MCREVQLENWSRKQSRWPWSRIDELLTNSPRENDPASSLLVTRVNGNAIELRGYGICLGHPIISVWNPLGNCLWRQAGPRSTVKCSLIRITVARLSFRYALGYYVADRSNTVPIQPYKPRSRSCGSSARDIIPTRGYYARSGSRVLFG